MSIGIIILFTFAVLPFVIGFKKAFVVFFCYGFLDYGLKFSGGLTYKDIILFAYLIFAVLRYHKRFYFLPISILFLGSFLMSEFLAKDQHWPSIFYTIMEYFAPAYILSCILDEIKTVKFLVYSLITTSAIVCLYSFLEIYLQTSPVVNLIWMLNGDEFLTMDGDIRYGIKRLQSFFIHATSFSYFCVVMFTFFVLYVDKTIRYYLNINFLLVIPILILLIICTFLTGTRSSILPLFFFSCFVIYKSSLKNSRTFIRSILIIIICLVIPILYFDSYINEVFLSFVDNNNFAGSSSNMRSGQFLATFKYWEQKPFWGHGMSFTGTVTFQDPDLYGAESIWMPLLMNNGIVGCIVYAYCIFKCYKFISSDTINALLFVGTIVFVNSLTSVPGLNLGFILAMCMVVKKMQAIKKCVRCKKYL